MTKQARHKLAEVAGACMGVVIGMAILSLVGCATVPSAYYTADRATYNAVAPEYLAYVEANGGLEDWQKDIRKKTIDSWNRRILSMEGGQ